MKGGGSAKAIVSKKQVEGSEDRVDDRTRSIATPSSYFMVLRQGGDVLARLEDLMRARGVRSASIVGFGLVAKARFGFFDFDKGDYDPREFEELEITGLTGTLA